MLTVGRFIVLKNGQNIKDYIDTDLERGRTWVPITYAMPDQIIFVIGSTLPVIEEGVGCIGTGIVIELFTDGKSTEITFKYVERDPKDPFCEALYALYQLQGTPVGGSVGGSNGSTFILPGMGGVQSGNSGSNIKPNQSQKKSSGNKKGNKLNWEDENIDDVLDGMFSGWSARNDIGF